MYIMLRIMIFDILRCVFCGRKTGDENSGLCFFEWF